MPEQTLTSILRKVVDKYKVEMTTVGLMLMGFNLARIVAVIGTMWKPKVCHAAGTAIGCTWQVFQFCQFSFLLMDPCLTPYIHNKYSYILLIPFAKTSSIVMFSFCTIAIGLFDASAAVYVYSKEVYGTE